MTSPFRDTQSVAVWVPQWGRLLVITRFETLVNDTTDPNAAIEIDPWISYEITGTYVVELGVQIAHLHDMP